MSNDFSEFGEELERAQEVADREHAHFVGQLNALWRTRRWKKFRLVEWVCRRCGQAVLQVMDTEPTPVVLTYSTEVREREWETLAAMEAADRLRAIKPVRRDRKLSLWVLPSKPPILVTGHIDFYGLCECSGRKLSASELFADLESGRRRRVLG